MKKLLLIAVLAALITSPARASCGFSATFGTGSSDEIRTASTTLGTTYSMSAWFWAHGAGGLSKGIIFDLGSNSGTTFAEVQFGGTTSLLQVSSTWSTTSGVWNVTAPSLSAWHNVVVTYDGSSTSNVPNIYIDGSALSVTTSAAPSGSLTANANVIHVGSNAGSGTFDGKLAEVAFWNSTVLTANEAKALAQGTSPLRVRYSALTHYVPCYLYATGSDYDWGSTHAALTWLGTPKQQPHPAIELYPQQPTGD